VARVALRHGALCLGGSSSLGCTFAAFATFLLRHSLKEKKKKKKSDDKAKREIDGENQMKCKLPTMKKKN
jgi:hypothetical protein